MAKFSASNEGIKLDLEDVKNVLDSNAEEEKVLEYKIGLDCNSDKIEYLLNESIRVECNVKNLGNNMLKDLTACLEEKCETVELGISQSKKIEFTKRLDKLGKVEFKIIAKNANIREEAKIEVLVLDKPSIEILNLEYPEEIEYNQDYEVKFSIKKNSQSNPKNIVVLFLEKDIEKEFRLEELKERDFIIKMNSKDLSLKDNLFKIEARYSDEKGNSYKSEESFLIKLVNLSFGQKIIVGVKEFGRWLERKLIQTKN